MGIREGGDFELITDLIHVLQNSKIDMTCFFSALSSPIDVLQTHTDHPLPTPILKALYKSSAESEGRALKKWLSRYLKRVESDAWSDTERIALQRRSNPRYILRNWLTYEAIKLAEDGDFSEVERLLSIIRNPYTEQDIPTRYSALRPDWAAHTPGCSQLSCSS